MHPKFNKPIQTLLLATPKFFSTNQKQVINYNIYFQKIIPLLYFKVLNIALLLNLNADKRKKTHNIIIFP